MEPSVTLCGGLSILCFNDTWCVLGTPLKVGQEEDSLEAEQSSSSAADRNNTSRIFLNSLNCFTYTIETSSV